VKQGLQATVRTFEKVAEEFIEQIEREVERGERDKVQGQKHPAVIRRYFVGYFSKKPVDAIADKDISRYMEWRKDYWISGPGQHITHIEYVRAGLRLRRPVRERKLPSLSRQRAEAVLLRSLFKQAARWGYLKTDLAPA
jgi:hypothetical protein